MQAKKGGEQKEDYKQKIEETENTHKKARDN